MINQSGSFLDFNLKRFLETIKTSADSKRDLDSWQMEFKNDVVKLNALQLAPVTIVFGNVRFKFLFYYKIAIKMIFSNIYYYLENYN